MIGPGLTCFEPITVYHQACQKMVANIQEPTMISNRVKIFFNLSIGKAVAKPDAERCGDCAD